jgi:hypothetical protein
MLLLVVVAIRSSHWVAFDDHGRLLAPPLEIFWSMLV